MDQFENKSGVFPFGKKARERIVKENTEEIKMFGQEGFDRIIDDHHYDVLDSPLDDARAGEVSFLSSFRTVLPEYSLSLQQYIEDALKDRKGGAVGVEFGGVGVKAFCGFSRGFFKQSAGVTLVDHRYDVVKGWDIQKMNTHGINHEVVVGDLLVYNQESVTDEAYVKLDEILKGEKVDLIMERMIKGLEFIPPDPFFINKTLQRWYKLLNDGGIMFVQVPTSFSLLLEEWSKVLSLYKDVLDFQSSPNIKGVNNPVFRLRKLSGAPSDLPVLDPKAVRRVSLNYNIES